jgi:hypothetical protein
MLKIAGKGGRHQNNLNRRLTKVLKEIDTRPEGLVLQQQVCLIDDDTGEASKANKGFDVTFK